MRWLLLLWAGQALASHPCLMSEAAFAEAVAGYGIDKPTELPVAAWGAVIRSGNAYDVVVRRIDGQTGPLLVAYCGTWPAAGLLSWVDGDAGDKTVRFEAPGTVTLPGSTAALAP